LRRPVESPRPENPLRHHGDGVIALFEKKTVRTADCALLIGTKKLFDFARDNPAIRLRSSEYTHNPQVLGRLERFVAINSAVEVDLDGQVNSEIAKGSYVGAIGGAPDFIRAANQSPGGVSLMLIPASRIVAKLSGPVSTPAATPAWSSPNTALPTCADAAAPSGPGASPPSRDRSYVLIPATHVKLRLARAAVSF